MCLANSHVGALIGASLLSGTVEPFALSLFGLSLAVPWGIPVLCMRHCSLLKGLEMYACWAASLLAAAALESNLQASTASVNVRSSLAQSKTELHT